MVTAALANERGFVSNFLTIDYGQRHSRELEAASRIAKHLNSRRHLVIPIDLRLLGGSALTGVQAVPKNGVKPGIPITYVPARNLIFLSLALAWAETIRARSIFIGVNALDYSGYPDCRPVFIESFSQTAQLATKVGVEGGKIEIEAPLLNWSKARIVRECARLGLDPAMSWSCYDPEPDGRACGRCDSCRLRRRGFQEARMSDPTLYAVD